MAQRAEAVGLGAFLETAEQHRKDDEDRDQQHDPQQAAAGPRSRPTPALAQGPVPVEPGPVHKRLYAQAQRDMPVPPNYLSRRG
jgi:hypothetical protein